MQTCSTIRYQQVHRTPLRGEVDSFLRELYESLAESLPDASDNPKVVGITHRATGSTVGIEVAAGHEEAEKVRYLPQTNVGNLWELWHHFQSTSGHSVSFKLFWQVYHESWVDVLRFRAKSSHAICSVCMKHKAEHTAPKHR